MSNKDTAFEQRIMLEFEWGVQKRACSVGILFRRSQLQATIVSI